MNWEDITEEQGEQWATDKRNKYRRGLLSPEIVAACESIDGWTWDLKVKTYLPFDEARALARSLQLKNTDEWKVYCRTRPTNMPSNPNVVYADRWVSLGDWLGTRRTRKVQPFDEARAFVRTLGLQTVKEWQTYSVSARPLGIPAAPDVAYANKGWVSWADWLNGKNHPKVWRSFEEARAFVHTLGLKTVMEWKVYARTVNKPADIPIKPAVTYKNNGWLGYSDWLGTNKFNRVIIRSFEEARVFAQSLHLPNRAAWEKLAMAGGLPSDIPRRPSGVYTNKGWVSWGDWLGTMTRKRQTIFLPFEEARAAARALGLKDSREYRNNERPAGLPGGPRCILQRQRLGELE